MVPGAQHLVVGEQHRALVGVPGPLEPVSYPATSDGDLMITDRPASSTALTASLFDITRTSSCPMTV
ncbi:hypothetical protein SFUMM280S_09016 [Streptomyces fumanus]